MRPVPRPAALRSLAAAAILGLAPLPACGPRRPPAAPAPTDGPGAPGAMIQLPGGTFRAGAPTGPRNDVVTYHRARPFLLDATEVTVAAYAACVAAGACRAAATAEWEGIRGAEREAASAYCNADRSDRADHPANCVDWAQATAYCAWAGKRLPTEEEWEWAARNGRRATPHPWGAEPPADRACWNGEGNAAGAGKQVGTCPVGTHPGGDSGAAVKDLAGNVWEWTSTAAVVLADGRGRGGTPVKVARGGGWTDADPRNVSAAVRYLEVPSVRRADLGFRCARRP